MDLRITTTSRVGISYNSSRLPSGNLLHSYGSHGHWQWVFPVMVIFCSYVSHYQRVVWRSFISGSGLVSGDLLTHDGRGWTPLQTGRPLLQQGLSPCCGASVIMKLHHGWEIVFCLGWELKYRSSDPKRIESSWSVLKQDVTLFCLVLATHLLYADT